MALLTKIVLTEDSSTGLSVDLHNGNFFVRTYRVTASRAWYHHFFQSKIIQLPAKTIAAPRALRKRSEYGMTAPAIIRAVPHILRKVSLVMPILSP
jgi:hypothetical protein